MNTSFHSFTKTLSYNFASTFKYMTTVRAVLKRSKNF